MLNIAASTRYLNLLNLCTYCYQLIIE